MAGDLELPDFENLPRVEGMPQGCAWGIFDNNGKKDIFGTLNLLTPAVVREAVAEVQDGVSVSLKYGSHLGLMLHNERILKSHSAGPSMPTRQRVSEGSYSPEKS
jgi:hypothetical protein